MPTGKISFANRLAASILIVLFCLSAAPAAERAADRLPLPLVAHLAVASPHEFVADLDKTVAAALAGIDKAGYQPGTIQLLAMFGSPLPASAWDDKGEAHVLVMARDKDEPEAAVVFSSGGLDRIAAVLSPKGKMVEAKGETILQAKIKGVPGTVHMVELPGGRILATDRPKSLLRFKKLLAEWTPPGVPEGGARLRLDVANILRVYAEEYEKGLGELRRELLNVGDVLNKIEEAREESDDPLALEYIDKGEKVILAWPGVANDLIRTGGDILESVGVVGLAADCAGEKLRLTMTMTAKDGTPLREYIDGVEKAPVPEFLFAGMIPDNAIVYSYTSNPTNLDRRAVTYVKDSVNALLGEAFPEGAGIFASLVDGYLDAGPKPSATALFRAADGHVVDALYSRWDKPEAVMPLAEKGVAAFMRLQKWFVDIANKRLTEMYADTIGPEADPADREWIEKLAKDGFEAPIEAVLRKGVYGSDKAPYFHLSLRDHLEQFVQPSRRDPAFSEKLAIIMEPMRQLDFLAVERDGIIAASIGNADGAGDAERLDRLFGGTGAGAKTIAALAASHDAGLPRQIAFSMVKPTEAVGYRLLQTLEQIAAGKPEIKNSVRRLFDALDGEGAYATGYFGAGDGALAMTLDLPARCVNVAARNFLRMEYEIERALKEALSESGGAFSDLDEDYDLDWDEGRDGVDNDDGGTGELEDGDAGSL